MATVITVVSGNLNDYGDSGTFESAYSGSSWGTNFGNFPSRTITRSSTVAKSGTYSCKIEGGSITQKILNKIGHFSVTNYNKYRATLWVYVPSANPITTLGIGSLQLKIGVSTQVNGYANISKTVRSAYDTWVQLEARWQGGATGTFDGWIDLAATSGVSATGIIYIDDLVIEQITEVNVNYDLQVTVTNAAGPGATGQIVLFGLPDNIFLGPYEYSVYGGAAGTYQSSGTFASLVPGTYNCVMRKQLTSTILVQKIVVLGINAPAWDFTNVGTNETSAGAADGTVTVIVSNNSGAPYEYNLVYPDGTSSGYGSTNSFTGLSPGKYQVYVRDTNLNVLSKFIGITAAPTCALSFTKIEITDATDEDTPDGAVQLSAFDDVFGGTAWYRLVPDGSQVTFTYPNGDNTTGLFENLLPGTYRFIAKTSETCSLASTLVVGSTNTYGTKYRLDFNQMIRESFRDYNGQTVPFGANNQFRLDLEQRAYAGSVTEVTGDGLPVFCSWRGDGTENPFQTILVASQLEVGLLSVTNGQFDEFLTSDERKYRAKLYIWDQWSGSSGAYRLIWQGYNISMGSTEPYREQTNYPISLLFTDGLADLSNKEFTDEGGNYFNGRISILRALTACLKKTGNRLNIHDKINMYCAGMDSSESAGTMAQVFFDPIIYQNSDGTYQSCAAVLSSILKGCRLYQSFGTWHVELVSEKCNASIYQQIYDINGVYLSNSIENNRYLLRNSRSPAPKLLFTGTPSRRISENYGRVDITYDLGLEDENNILDYSKFEAVDIESGQLKGWAVTKFVENGGITYGLEKIPNRDNDFAFYAAFGGLTGSPTVQDQILWLRSDFKTIEWPGAAFNLRLKFDVYTRPFFTDPYIYLDYNLVKVGGTGGAYWLQAKEVYTDDQGLQVMRADTNELVDSNYIRTYIDEHLNWKTITHDIVIEEEAQCGSFQVYFAIKSNAIYDVTSVANLKALTTGSNKRIQTYDNRRRVKDVDNGVDVIREYRLLAGTKATSSPDIERPNDYASGTNQFYWNLEKTYPMPTTTDGILTFNLAEWLQNILIDNVRLEYLPNQEDPIEEINYTESIDRNTPTVLEDTTLHGDIFYSEDQDLGDQELDPNYALIMNGHFTLPDGTPTFGGWFRRGVTENKFYHELLAKMMRGQFSLSRWQLSGTMETRERLMDFTKTIHEIRTGRVYLLMDLSVDYRNATAILSMRESVKGEAVDDSVGGGATEIPTPEPGDDAGGGQLGQHGTDHSEEHD